MASSILGNLWAAPHKFPLHSELKSQSRSQIRSSAARDSSVLSSNTAAVNGFSYVKEEEKTSVFGDVGNGHLNSSTKQKKEEEVFQEKLGPLWDDGYGSQSVKDYLDLANEMIKPDGGPPRWFSPISCGPPLRNAPVLLFLPGMLALQFYL